jgi:hypothetical protein
MLSMLSGDPGCGKSFIALYIAAELSRGRLCDRRLVEPANTLYLSLENPIAEAVRPRFDSLGGDSSRLFMLDDSLTLADTAKLEATIRRAKARFVIVDPIQSYLGSGIDLHRSNETRPVMDGIARIADSCDCAFLMLRHLSKQRGGKAIHGGLGSVDLTGAVRSELMAGSLPDAPDMRAVVHIKSNIGHYGATVGYTIDEDGFRLTGESQITAADLMATPEGAEERSDTDSAIDFLKETLSAGPRPMTYLESSSGINTRTLQRAAKRMGVTKTREGERGKWIWSLPASESPKATGDTIDDNSDHRRQHSMLSPMQNGVAYTLEPPTSEVRL